MEYNFLFFVFRDLEYIYILEYSGLHKYGIIFFVFQDIEYKRLNIIFYFFLFQIV